MYAKNVWKDKTVVFFWKSLQSVYFFSKAKFSVGMKAAEIMRETHGFCRSLFPLAKSL